MSDKLCAALLAPHDKAIKAHSASYWAEHVRDAKRALTKAQTAAILTEGDGYITVRSERMGASLFGQGLVNRLPEKWDAGVFKLTPLGRDVVLICRTDHGDPA